MEEVSLPLEGVKENGMEPWPENEVMDVFDVGCCIDCALA